MTPALFKAIASALLFSGGFTAANLQHSRKLLKLETHKRQNLLILATLSNIFAHFFLWVFAWRKGGSRAAPTRQRKYAKKRGTGEIALYAMLIVFATMAIAQDQQDAKNPLAGNPNAINQGQRQFVLQCAYCHGVDASGGGRGPDLTSGRWLHGDSDGAIFRTITHGIPGTEMPSCGCPDEEAWQLVTFLRSLSARTAAPVKGDVANGERIFFGSSACSSCHVAKGRGGRFGPDLSRIGAARSARSLVESIREPDKVIAPGYETVVAVAKDGKRVTGVRKNEDTFTVQLMDQSERFHLLRKRDLREVLYDRKSLMPAYDERSLNEKDLRDLVAFLDSLRGN